METNGENEHAWIQNENKAQNEHGRMNETERTPKRKANGTEKKLRRRKNGNNGTHKDMVTTGYRCVPMMGFGSEIS